jgi:hypothetical protein
VDNFSSIDNMDSKELSHDTFKEVDSVGITLSSDADVKDMSRMGKDQQFKVSVATTWKGTDD